MSDEPTTGYESGSYQESSTARSQPYQSNGGYRGGNSGNWNNPHRQAPGGQSRNFSGGGKFAGGNRNQPPRDFDKDPAIFYKPYFVASNDNPPPSLEIIERATKIRDVLAHHKFIVRTAMMNDLDKKFADVQLKEMMLPFRGWNELDSKFTFVSEEAKFLAKLCAPQWDSIQKDVVKTFLAKNVRLAQGQNCKSPARFGLIWSLDGAEKKEECSRETGNVKHIIDVCAESAIPVFNIQRTDTLDRLLRYLNLKAPG